MSYVITFDIWESLYYELLTTEKLFYVNFCNLRASITYDNNNCHSSYIGQLDWLIESNISIYNSSIFDDI